MATTDTQAFKDAIIAACLIPFGSRKDKRAAVHRWAELVKIMLKN